MLPSPPGLQREHEASAGYAVLRRNDISDDEAPAAPELVALFVSRSARLRASRRLMMSSITTAEPAALLSAMTGHWSEWPVADEDERRYRRTGEVAGSGDDDHAQVAWAEADRVIWIVATGITDAELQRFVTGVRASPDEE